MSWSSEVLPVQVADGRGLGHSVGCWACVVKTNDGQRPHVRRECAGQGCPMLVRPALGLAVSCAGVQDDQRTR